MNGLVMATGASSRLGRAGREPAGQIGVGLDLAQVGTTKQGAFTKLAAPCTILSLRAVRASFVLH